jgi:hypothetical protein
MSSNNQQHRKRPNHHPPTDTQQQHQPLLSSSISPPRTAISPPTDTQAAFQLGRVDTFVPQKPGFIAITPIANASSNGSVGSASGSSNSNHLFLDNSSSSSSANPLQNNINKRPQKQQQQHHHHPLQVASSSASSDLSFSSSNRPPTDTFSMPFPNGYYRVEFPVKLPSIYPELLPNKLRYTAASVGFQEFATSTPFNRKPYTLRQQEAKHRTKMMVVITMYNEDVDLFSLTLG